MSLQNKGFLEMSKIYVAADLEWFEISDTAAELTDRDITVNNKAFRVLCPSKRAVIDYINGTTCQLMVDNKPVATNGPLELLNLEGAMIASGTVTAFKFVPDPTALTETEKMERRIQRRKKRLANFK